MNVAELIVKLGADVSNLEAGLARGQALVEGAARSSAAVAREVGKAQATAAREAEVAQERFAAAVTRTGAQLQLLKGDSFGALKTAFPTISDADLGKFATLRGELTQIKGALAEQIAEVRLAEAEQQRFAAAIAKTSAELSTLKGDKLASLRFQFPGASEAELGNLQKMRKEVEALGKAKQQSLFGALTSAPAQHLADAGLMVGGGIAALGGLAVKEAGDFDTAMHDMQASARVSGEEFKEWHDGILALGKDPNVTDGPTKLAKAMYEIASLGYHGKEALDMLGHSAHLATGGLADVKDTAHLLDAVMKSGIGGFHGVAEASNILARAVHMGAVHVQELAEKFPQLAQLAKGAHITLQDILAVYIGLTRRGIDAGKAQELLGQLLVALLKPSKQAQGIFQELGISYGITGVRATGLTGVLKQMGVAMKDHADELVRGTGRIQGMQAALASTDQDGKEWKDTLGGMASAQHGMGAELESSAEQMKGFGAQSRRVHADVERLGVEIGEKFLPHVKDGMAAIDRLLTKWDELSPAKQDRLIGGVKDFAIFALISSGAVKAIKAVADVKTALTSLGAMPALAKLAKGPGGFLALESATASSAYDTVASTMGMAAFEQKLKADQAAGKITQGEMIALAHKRIVDEASGFKGFMARMFGADIPTDISPGEKMALAGMEARRASEQAMAERSAANLEGFKLPAGVHRVPPAVHPAGASAAEIAAKKQLAAATKELGGLQAALNEAHHGGSKIAEEVAKRYNLLGKALRDQIVHAREAKIAHDQHTAALAKEHEAYGKAVGTVTGAIADLRKQLQGQDTDLDALRRTYPDLTGRELARLDGLNKQRDALAALKKHSDEWKTSLGESTGLADRLHAAAGWTVDKPLQPGEIGGGLARQFADYERQRQALKDQVSLRDGLKKSLDDSALKLREEYALAAAGGDKWDVYSLSLQHVKKGYDELTPAAKEAIDQLSQLGREHEALGLLSGLQHELVKAAAGFDALRSADPLGLLSAEHLGLSDATLERMNEYQQLLLGMKNAGAAMASALDPVKKKVVEALEAFAGTKGLVADQVKQYEQILAFIQAKGRELGPADPRRASDPAYQQARMDALSRPTMTPEQIQQLMASGVGFTSRQLAQNQASLTPQGLNLLQQAAGDLRPYFGQTPKAGDFREMGKELEDSAKEMQAAFKSDMAPVWRRFDDELDGAAQQLRHKADDVMGHLDGYLRAAADGFNQDTRSVFTFFGDGLKQSIEYLNRTIQYIGQEAVAALQRSGGGIAGARAEGGPVSSGSAYLVGERGPELFVPSSGGTIVPNGAGGATIHAPVHMTVVTPDAASFHRSGGQIMQDAGRAIQRHMARNGS